MALSSDLISQLVKVTKEPKKPSESTVHGVAVEYEGRTYVKLDGSDLLTPVTITSSVKDGDRVTVLIKDHVATVNGNISDPSASSYTVKEQGDQISEFDTIIAHTISADEITAIKATFDDLRAITGKFDNLEAINAKIDELEAKYINVDHLNAKDIEAINASIQNLEVEFGKFTNLSAENLEAIYANIGQLKAYTGDFTYLSAESFQAVKADIEDLYAKKLNADSAEIKYANIDFANIGEAAIKKLFADYGLITNLVIKDQHITGELVGVTIRGDRIIGNTLIADALIIKGKDGLYYRLNAEGGATLDPDVTEEALQNGLHGKTIIAHTITADKVHVSDLVAFGATIGGFHIKDHSLHSGVKESASNTTRGVFLGDDGQVAFGDANNFLKYYKDANGNYKLDVSASSISLGTSSKSDVATDVSNAQEAASDAQDAAYNNSNRINDAEAKIDILDGAISMLVTDANGSSKMTHNGSGWTFDISQIESGLNSTASKVNDLETGYNGTKSAVDDLSTNMAVLSPLKDYIVIKSYNNQPCIELGESNNDFKLRITNTAIQFSEGTVVPAYISNQKLMIEKAEVKNELQFGEFVWKPRSNGNMGLIWKGGGS